MKNNFERWSPVYILIAIFINYVIFVFLSEGTVGGADDIVHYRYARYAFQMPEFFIHHWGKPIFTTLSAPFAQFGFNGFRIFNVLTGTATAYLCYLIARQLDLKYSVFVIFLLIFSPLYSVMMLTGLTEILFGFILMLSVYLFFKEKFILSSVVISFLPLARTEGIIIIPLFLLAFALNRKFRAIPFLFSGLLLYSLLGSFYHKDFFWLINQMPYTGEAYNIYGKGDLLYYFKASKLIFGIPQAILIVAGIIFIAIKIFTTRHFFSSRLLNEILVAYIPFMLYFLAHVYVYWKGKGNSVGLIRYMAAVVPSSALVALYGWDSVLGLIHDKKIFKQALTVALSFYLIFLPFKLYKIPVPLSPPMKLIKEASSWLKETGYSEHMLFYYDPFWFFFLDINPYNRERIHGFVYDPEHPEKGIPAGGIVLWDAHFSPNEGKLPLDRMKNNPCFQTLKIFRPEKPFKVLGGYDYEVYLFQRLPDSLCVGQPLLSSDIHINNTRSRVLKYLDYEKGPFGADSLYIKSGKAHDGEYSFYTGSGKEFINGYSAEVREMKPDKKALLRASVYFYTDTLTGREEIYLVASLEHRKEIYYYKTREIITDSTQSGSWQKALLECSIPHYKSGNDLLKVYLWNKSKQSIYFDDFLIEMAESSEDQQER